MQLTAPDEFFNHQVALPHSVVGNSDPAWRERYWISVQDTTRDDLILSLGFGKYPNHDVTEAFAILQHGDTQHNLVLSREMGRESDRIAVGPLRADVIEPLERLRFVLDRDNKAGFSFDLNWTGAGPCLLEDKHFEVNRARVTHDIIRYVQLGRIGGTIGLPDGSTATLSPETAVGQRDHSWGIRPMAPPPGAPPVKSVEWTFLAFMPFVFPTFSMHLYLFESAPGRPVHLSALVGFPDGSVSTVERVDHDFDWDVTAPAMTLKGGRLAVLLSDGRRFDIEVAAKTPRVYLSGGGYGHDQGRYKGIYSEEADTYDLSDHDRLRGYAIGSSDHAIELTCDGDVGHGIIEYIVRRGHPYYAGREAAKR
ncbi:MAG: hypothetical protein ACU0CX_11495 [Sagittula sp.]|uniref:hypothetical protein n=1 Tax=Sagittula sp. TaxID=2038081 RepID=UPI00405957B8